jgi:hypothetical protein
MVCNRFYGETSVLEAQNALDDLVAHPIDEDVMAGCYFYHLNAFRKANGLQPYTWEEYARKFVDPFRQPQQPVRRSLLDRLVSAVEAFCR